MSTKKKMKKLFNEFMPMFPGMVSPEDFMGQWGWSPKKGKKYAKAVLKDLGSNIEACFDEAGDTFRKQMKDIQKASKKVSKKQWKKFTKLMGK